MYFLRYLLLIILFYNCYNVQSQSKLSTEVYKIRKQGSIEEKISQLRILLSQQDTLQAISGLEDLYGDLSGNYGKNKIGDSVVFFAKKAIKLREASKVKNLKLLNKDRYRLAYGYKLLKLTKERQEILNQIIKSNQNQTFTFLAYRGLSNIEKEKGDIYKSLQHLNSALANKELCKNLDSELKIRFLIITTYAQKYESNFNAKKNTLDLKTIENHKIKIEKSFHKSKIEDIELYNMYNNLAVILDAFGELDKALSLYIKTKDFYFANGDSDIAYRVLMNIGMIYSRQKKINDANICYNTIIKESNSLELKAGVYNNMGYYLNTTTSKDKIPFSQKAVNTSLNIPVAINKKFKLPNLETIETSGNKQDILIYLIDLAQHEVKAYKQDNSSGYLKNALQTLTLVDKLVSLIRYQTTSEQSKLFWIEKGVDSYMLAAEVSYLLNDTDKLFYFIEKNKALLLQESITTLQNRLTSNIPNTILEREYKLHYKRLDAYKSFQDDINNIKAQKDFVLQDKNYTVFMDSLQQHYPNYTKIKKEVAIVEFKTITSNANTCFVEYILNDTDGYGILYCDNEVSIFKVKDVPTLQKQLITLKSYFTSPVLNTTEKETLQHTGQEVFNTLFPVPDIVNKLSGKHFTIIPDYTLETFPFEALSVTKNSPLKESYFINNTEISYLQSFSVFKQIQQKQNTPEETLLAIAPHTFTDQSLPELTGTKAIIDKLSNYTSSTMLYETDATHANFLKYRNNYEIIHLSTHAGTNNSTQNPWIAFKDYNMPLNELYGLENQAELVVLDACETNTGELAIGEGTISLSRGFFFNGAQSVMASLWNVNEKAGNTVVNQFYNEIQSGVTKSKALQVSKIQYLKSHEFSEALPYYWAAFTLTGSTKTIALSTKPSYILIFGSIGIVVILIIGFLWFRKQNIT